MNTNIGGQMGPYELAAYRAGEPIRDIVRRGQDTLSRLQMSLIWREHRDRQRKELVRMFRSGLYNQWMPYDEPVSTPQTLGELCLELMPVLERYYCVTPDGLGTAYFQYFYPDRVAQKKALRRAMYHKPQPVVSTTPKSRGNSRNSRNSS